MMKKLIAILMLQLATTVSLAEGPVAQLRSVGSDTNRFIIVPPTDSIDLIVGRPTNQWLYVWPHDILPASFASFGIKSTPADETKRNRGMTMHNWRRPVTLTNHLGEVNIICKRDYPMSRTQPWSSDAVDLGATYTKIDFHDLACGARTRRSADGTLAHRMVFRHTDIRFEIEATGTKEEDCKTMTLSVAEQVFANRERRTPTSSSNATSNPAAFQAPGSDAVQE